MALNKRNVLVGAARLFIGPFGTSKPGPTVGDNYVETLQLETGDAEYDTWATANAALVGTGSDPESWEEVGFTTDGVEFATDPTYDEITVDQQMDAVRIFKSGMTASISTTLAEATLENLVVAWGQPNNTLNDLTPAGTGRELVVHGGELGDAPVERGLIAVGNGPELAAGGKFTQRIYHLYRVLSVEGSTVNMSRTDPTTIPVTFRALPDDATGRYGTIRDRGGVDGLDTPA